MYRRRSRSAAAHPPSEDPAVTRSGVSSRWVTLLVMTRLLGAAVAVVLLIVHRVTAHDGALIAVTLAYTAASLLLVRSLPRLAIAPAAWLVDAAVVLALVAASEDWRSPFYIYMLTALILPATGMRFRPALAWGAAFALAYLGVAVFTELDANTLRSTIRLETIATHLMVPLVVVLALAYAEDLLERLRGERLRAERLAVERERQRIAWELHDSAKQRVHSAHLVLSALRDQVSGTPAELVDHALVELRSAGADMDTSIAELRTPLSGRPVERLLAERARELAPASGARISVSGTFGELPADIAAHAYRIGAEALTNAVRHGDAETIDVTLGRNGACATLEVVDDGRGLPAVRRPGAFGLRSMRARAETIGGALTLEPGGDGRGTRVLLRIPLGSSG